MATWELRAVSGRAVLVAAGAGAGSGVDPRSLDIGAELAGSLDEWASVAQSMQQATPRAARLVTWRGQQLAGRLAAATGSDVAVADPLGGAAASGAGASGSGTAGRGAAPGVGAEPTPWATGLVVAGFAVFVVVFAMVALSLALGRISPWLAFAANLVVTLGLAPTIVVIRPLPVWRWVANGCGVGIAAGWLAWLFGLL